MGRAQEVASQGLFSDFWFVKVNGWWGGCPLRQETQEEKKVGMGERMSVQFSTFCDGDSLAWWVT